jgi:hypothetical protein
MGENMVEAAAFDHMIQSVSEGSYRPTASAGMETFPVRSGEENEGGGNGGGNGGGAKEE